MERDPTYERVLGVFASYGFRKTSMAELADAANVSRQTLYNRFKTKEAVLDWAVGGFSAESEALCIEALDDAGLSAERRIVGFFSELVGTLAPMLHSSSHGAEIFELGKAARRRTHDQSYEKCIAALIGFLGGRDAVGCEEKAGDLAYALSLTAKGLLMVSADRDQFDAGMARVTRAVLPAE
ncbi:MAG: TetR/AcrR family transcriptional regulator [Pseudomonadota bacterium]